MTSWDTLRGVGDSELGQYATPADLAKLVVSRFGNNVETAIDLGSGPGALTRALQARYPMVNVTMIDIDRIGEQADVDPDRTRFLQRSVLSVGFATRIRNEFGAFDVAISNPPFVTVRSDPPRYLTEALQSQVGAPRYRAELAFAAQALKCVGERGAAAIFMPSEILRPTDGMSTIEALLHLELEELLVLPGRVFRHVEVDTVALIFRRRGARRKKVRLYTVSSDFSLSYCGWKTCPEIEDLLFSIKRPAGTGARTLGAIGAGVKRGRHSSSQLREMARPFFHTTSFGTTRALEVAFDSSPKFQGEEFVVAKQGDILIPRVGSRCMDKAAIVTAGARPISDCVIQLRLPDAMIGNVWDFISSEQGVIWRRSLTRGSCAKFIPQASLLSTPLPANFRF
ncbi:class I SAM-dependent methyltransferase [Cupriavidus malaysiensis]|uniref:class I SAM-dependent methyltransferase n=1 Tax=Cupriavidus malaysiensis TaxID=367825 RepID=UPI000A03850A|nr:N-6 DNA methylase [Cupriavidus malaysiensis]